MRRCTIPLAVLLACSSPACAGDAPEPAVPIPTPPATHSAAPPPAPTATISVVAPAPPPKKATAREVVEGGATFMFSLADSPDAQRLALARCQGMKDREKRGACVAQASHVAAGEGLRFERTDKGLRFVMFGRDKDREVVHVDAIVVVEASDDAQVRFQLPPKAGKKGPEQAMTFRLVDEVTLQTTDPRDPKKGALVYKKGTSPVPLVDFPEEQQCHGGPCFLGSACVEPPATEPLPKLPNPYHRCEHSLPSNRTPVRSPPATYFFSREATDEARSKAPNVCCYRATHYAG